MCPIEPVTSPRFSLRAHASVQQANEPREKRVLTVFFFSFLPPFFPCRCIQVTVSGGFYREADQTAAPALEETPLSGTLYLA